MVDANEVASGTVTATPQANATAVAQDLLKQQDKQIQRNNTISWALLSAVGSSLGTGIGGIGTIFVAFAAFRTAANGLKQWQGNREDEQAKRDKEQERWQKEREEEQRKRDEERFQSAVEGLGSERIEAKVGAAIMLRTFLREGYEQFHRQVFDLAVAHLRLLKTSTSSEDQTTPLPLTSLHQALIDIFKDGFPLVRDGSKKSLQPLDATGINVDNAYLANADLSKVRMSGSHLRKVNLNGVNLSEAVRREVT
jgi:hypothetical protein